MGINSIIALLGGLGAFLFGMKYMGEGLELAAGPKMKELLEKADAQPDHGLFARCTCYYRYSVFLGYDSHGNGLYQC